MATSFRYVANKEFSMNDHGRKSGKTTKILEESLKELKKEKPPKLIIIVGYGTLQCDYMVRLLLRLCKDKKIVYAYISRWRYKLENTEFRFVTKSQNNIDKKFKDYSSKTPIYYDHYMG